MFYGIDRYYLILVVPALLISMYAQWKVSSTFKAFSSTATRSGLTGAGIARKILDLNGLQNVRVERIAGNLTDHYDPRDNVVRLSDTVYGSASISAVGVAAHETGHAVQHATKYVPMRIRAAIIPATNIGSKLSIPLVMFGLLFSIPMLTEIGIIFFSLSTVFQLVTLPVEFNASHRAIATLDSTGLVSDVEKSGVRKVLTAAALTYVAALLVAIAQLLRLVLLFGRHNDD
ncbi:MAG: zinc metallopeptidase [Oscillospiraceae bacterium]